MTQQFTLNMSRWTHHWHLKSAHLIKSQSLQKRRRTTYAVCAMNHCKGLQSLLNNTKNLVLQIHPLSAVLLLLIIPPSRTLKVSRDKFLYPTRIKSTEILRTLREMLIIWAIVMVMVITMAQLITRPLTIVYIPSLHVPTCAEIQNSARQQLGSTNRLIFTFHAWKKKYRKGVNSFGIYANTLTIERKKRGKDDWGISPRNMQKMLGIWI